MEINEDSIKLSIGLPVYNGEQFLHERISSILSQTFKNYELIISDNNSNDKTTEICKKFANQDSRIKYFRQKVNIGAEKNFKFVLDHAKNDYFVWAAADDIWEKTFLEKNIENLSSNKKLVGSISNVLPVGENSRRSGSKFKDFAGKINSKFSKYGSHTLSGTYEEKIKKCLEINSAQNVYGIFRTNELKESVMKSKNSATDLCVILKIIKFGDIGVIDEDLLRCRTTGISGKGNIESIVKLYGLKSLFIPHFTFMRWFIENYGIKLFLKNFYLFYKINLGAFLGIIYDILLKIIKN